MYPASAKHFDSSILILSSKTFSVLGAPNPTSLSRLLAKVGFLLIRFAYPSKHRTTSTEKTMRNIGEEAALWRLCKPIPRSTWKVSNAVNSRVHRRYEGEPLFPMATFFSAYLRLRIVHVVPDTYEMPVLRLHNLIAYCAKSTFSSDSNGDVRFREHSSCTWCVSMEFNSTEFWTNFNRNWNWFEDLRMYYVSMAWAQSLA